MRCVVDASVVVKWVLRSPEEEPHTTQALDLLEGIRAGAVEVLQPPHWLAEAAAVLLRLIPDSAPQAVGLLCAMDLPVAEGPRLYVRACSLAVRLQHHLFDTLYHAVALEEPGLSLVTADDHYYTKAVAQGSIDRLADLRLA